MLYNSYGFIFLFLPLTLLVFYQLGQRGYQKIALSWLVGASLFFYGSWNPIYLSLFIISLITNYCLGKVIAEKEQGKVSSLSKQVQSLERLFVAASANVSRRRGGTLLQTKPPKIRSRFKFEKIVINRRWLLILGIIFNLATLAYFKYANFFVDSVNDFIGTQWTLNTIIMPLGISFITFEQIAYLVDTYKGKTEAANLLNYCLFISFFPKLISGPIVRYKELLPQLKQTSIFQNYSENISVGLTIFSMGLFKKVVLADNLAPHVTLIYGAVTQGTTLSFFEVWTGVLAHALRLYFDFSGYSDMAIGVARMFGIKLPLNFESPYKATNINQFWSHWHMTLTRFFRDYVYLPLSRWLKKLPLGEGATGQTRETAINTMITFTLTGLWHGAGWNFLIWGALHGVYLVIYQQWRDFRRKLGHNPKQSSWWGKLIGCTLTFLAWIFALVLSKTDNFEQTWAMWRSMLGLNGISLPDSLATSLGFLQSWGFEFKGLMPNFYIRPLEIIPSIILLLLIVWFTPNTQQWMGQYQPAIDHYPLKISVKWQAKLWPKLQWKPVTIWAFISSMIFLISLVLMSREQDFIYFQY